MDKKQIKLLIESMTTTISAMCVSPNIVAGQENPTVIRRKKKKKIVEN